MGLVLDLSTVFGVPTSVLNFNATIGVCLLVLDPWQDVCMLVLIPTFVVVLDSCIGVCMLVSDGVGVCLLVLNLGVGVSVLCGVMCLPGIIVSLCMPIVVVCLALICVCTSVLFAMDPPIITQIIQITIRHSIQHHIQVRIHNLFDMGFVRLAIHIMVLGMVPDVSFPR